MGILQKTFHFDITWQEILLGDLKPLNVIQPVWWKVSIYDGPERYEEDLRPFALSQRLVFAMQWYKSEVNNGGHKQFFANATGIVWKDALQGFETVGLDQAATILHSAVNRMGGDPSLERAARTVYLEEAKPNFDDLDNAFYEIVNLDAVIMEYVKRNVQDFVFSGDVVFNFDDGVPELVGLAFMIVDVQEAMITGAMYRERDVLDNIVHLLAEARAAGALVIYVRHDYGVGHEWAKGTPGWEIWSEIAPLEGEEIVDKRRSSAFMGTRLAIFLHDRGVKQLVIVGVHTEYCVNATILGASERRYNVTIPELTNTTHGNEYMTAPVLYEYYHRKIWHGRYGTVMPVDDVVAQFRTWGETNGRKAASNNL